MVKLFNKDYYLEPVKIIRDLVHEYINLTRFELDLIDTASFQRLKDIRQLTCQQVYPAARHTRFEHSLGVLELTKQAIKHLNRNGLIEKSNNKDTEIINEKLQFNATIAALLHDVGHCPFSHLGEVEIDKEQVREYLLNTIKETTELKHCTQLIEKLDKENAKGIGSKHEQLSCIVILKKYYPILANIPNTIEDGGNDEKLSIDFELIIRSILGILYDDKTVEDFENNKIKNVIVNLINSSIFDMDKLDYIMRDSFFTGIGTPRIDTHRLFRNMFFNNDYSLVFTSKAIPALQNMIDSRDELYMYVYNHHAVIFSDFMNAYIFRKLAHNSEYFINMLLPDISEEEKQDELDSLQISSIGLIPRSYLFSPGSILTQNRSDGDWISLLNIILYNKYCVDNIELKLNGEISSYLETSLYSVSQILLSSEEFNTKKKILSEKILSTYNLVERLQNRSFLKPWWKTVFEFSNFMQQNFRDDEIRKKIGKMVCNENSTDFDASEFRSQIAKHVIFITQKLKNDSKGQIIEELNEGDFFIVQRSNRFLALEAIEKLDIALKTSEIIGSPNDIKYRINDYYIKYLTNIIPQKDYSAIYDNEGFYIYSKQIEYEDVSKKKRHYEEIERIFVFVATEFIKQGVQRFNQKFLVKSSDLEVKSKDELYNSYIKKFDL